jgi:hypothetical protein
MADFEILEDITALRARPGFRCRIPPAGPGTAGMATGSTMF